MKKLLLLSVVVCGISYGMAERQMLTELLALQRIQVGKNLVKIAQENICIKCGSNDLQNMDGTARFCRSCRSDIDVQELRSLAPQGIYLIREGLALLNSIQEPHGFEPMPSQIKNNQIQED